MLSRMSEDSIIRLLPIHVANKIAAGEVVDRPGSVVKELMENAIDAGATQLDVSVTAGGKKLIQIVDNGKGMGRDDALLSIERHATSKIRDVDDIEQISTLGFRGEALAAVASVSRFRLESCPRGGMEGTQITVMGGTIQDVREVGCPEGTSMEVRDLFFNVPARRKFLRSQQTELFHVRDTFIVEALSHPEVGMSLTIDGRSTYCLPASERVHDRIRELFGAGVLDSLRDADYTGEEVQVTGMVSIPSVTRSDRSEQYLFVNGRPIAASTIGYAIREGYAGGLSKGRHPSVFLFLQLDPGLVDVNVHPKKQEVRFRHPSAVRDSVIEAVREALAGRSSAEALEGDAAAPTMPPPQPVAFDPIGHLPAEHRQLPIPELAPATPTPYSELLQARAQSRTTIPLPEDLVAADIPAEDEGNPAPSDAEPPEGSQALPAEAPWRWCRVVGQVGGIYAVLETEDGMVLMDPRAAHERVLYDRLMGAVAQGNVSAQALLLPETVALPHRDAERVTSNLEALQSLGFGISDFGGDSFMVDAVPACLHSASIHDMVVEVAHRLDTAGKRGGENWQQETVAKAACRAAVPTRGTLSTQELDGLVRDLAMCEMPYTSPFGRPTLIFTSLNELSRKFGRT